MCAARSRSARCRSAGRGGRMRLPRASGESSLLNAAARHRRSAGSDVPRVEAQMPFGRRGYTPGGRRGTGPTRVPTGGSHWFDSRARGATFEAMEWWPFTPSEFYAAFGAPDPTTGVRDESESGGQTGWGAEEPGPVEVSLLEIVYGFIAAETGCCRCDTPLGRRLRVDAWPTLLGATRWRVSVKTSCRGWRRHRHTAAVGRTSAGVLLGPFRGASW